MGIVIENGGVLTTVQDEGRFGYQAYGVSTSGAMDSHAFHIANLLVGNEMTEGSGDDFYRSCPSLYSG